jgi:hypothetical protein
MGRAINHPSQSTTPRSQHMTTTYEDFLAAQVIAAQVIAADAALVLARDMFVDAIAVRAGFRDAYDKANADLTGDQAASDSAYVRLEDASKVLDELREALASAFDAHYAARAAAYGPLGALPYT